jgi:AraC-like DNA-binding protein
MELNNDYLTLQPRRLKASESLDLIGRGLLFLIIKGGQGVCHCGSALHRLGAGTVLVLDTVCQGRIQASSDGEMTFWCFVAELEHLFPLFSGREICLLQKLAESFKTGRVHPGSSPLAKECLKLAEDVPVQFSLDHRSHVLRIVSAILTAEFKDAQPKLADLVPMQDHVLQVFERLQTNELLSLPVGELAKKFNCSRRHLNRLFHQHFGVSAAALRMEMRLMKAVSLLVDPDAKIIHVAENCGFNHLGLFNTCFRKRFGSSPGEWRKTVTQASNRPTTASVHGQPFQSEDSCLASGKTDARRSGKGRTHSLERVALGGLLQDMAAMKTGIIPQAFGRKGSIVSLPSAGTRSESRMSVSA